MGATTRDIPRQSDDGGGTCAGRQSSASTRWPATGRTPEVEAEKSEELGEKITIHRGEETRCRVMCTHARPPPFVRMHARNASGEKILPPGTPWPHYDDNRRATGKSHK